MFNLLKHVDWLDGDHIRPYVYVRPENKIINPGQKHQIGWFRHTPVYINPLDINELKFAEQIYYLEGRAFGPSNMTMPRWVFYDCAVIPGFVAGFAYKTSEIPQALRDVMAVTPGHAWTPLSLFIIIPTMRTGEWVAHNLCSVNSLLPEEDRFYGLGFLSKAFGLWYANVETCCGMTQWGGPAIKLHTHFGQMEIMTAYTPVHSYAKTLTYRLIVDTSFWERFFSRREDEHFKDVYASAGVEIDPQSEVSMRVFQERLQKGEGPFYLSAAEIAKKNLSEPLTVFVRK